MFEDIIAYLFFNQRKPQTGRPTSDDFKILFCFSVLYADYVASGRSLKFLEDYIAKEVLPAYGNTHTTTSVTGFQSTLYRHEARSIVRDCVNASEHDAVIFCGTGCTGAVRLLINALDLSKDSSQTPVVIAGPYDHHSTLLPWRELTEDDIIFLRL
ncbi:uncharacterized protein [Watersipora subatra]|uniref:uncharacterized protein n=1 Tax=Watersipora subatra TaxID=2589382 RepID=UPI00355B53D5